MTGSRRGIPAGFFFGESKVLFHLAEGTFARVYRGEHMPTKAPVAIKVLRQRFATIPEAVERFHKEAEAGMRLRHPNIVQVIDVGQQENRHFMIMEYVEGMNLRDFMKLRVSYPAEQALPLMLGMAQGLQYSLDAGRHASRHQGNQHPDLQHGRRQAGRFRTGHHARATNRSRASRASAPSITRRSSAPATARKAIPAPTSTSSDASSTRW